MDIQDWPKVGEPRKLAGKYGKELWAQDFRNPVTGEVVEFTFFRQNPWSVVLAITPNGKMIRCREFKQGRNSVAWELPGGTADFEDESPETVMHRELRQETGYKAGKVIYLGKAWPATRSADFPFHCFVAFDCTLEGEQELDSNEIIERELYPLEEWVADMFTESHENPSCVVTTMRALRHIRDRYEALASRLLGTISTNLSV